MTNVLGSEMGGSCSELCDYVAEYLSGVNTLYGGISLGGLNAYSM